MWFVLFNAIAVVYLAATDRLQLNLESVLTAVFVLLLMNGIALISARNFPEWK